MVAATDDRIKEVLNRAKKEPVKGRYYIYERYKSELLDICKDYQQLDRAIAQLVRILRV